MLGDADVGEPSNVAHRRVARNLFPLVLEAGTAAASGLAACVCVLVSPVSPRVCPPSRAFHSPLTTPPWWYPIGAYTSQILVGSLYWVACRCACRVSSCSSRICSVLHESGTDRKSGSHSVTDRPTLSLRWSHQLQWKVLQESHFQRAGRGSPWAGVRPRWPVGAASLSVVI